MSETSPDFSIPAPLDGAAAAPTRTEPVFAKKPKGRPKKKLAPGEKAGTRVPDDAYDTPEECALACVKWCRDQLSIPDEPLVLDPCAGNGPFSKAARSVWPDSRVVAIDIRKECQEPCEATGAKFVCMDALDLEAPTISRAHLITTNPPFKIADQLIQHLWLSMKPGAILAFLLPVTFIASAERWEPGGSSKPTGLYTVAPLRYMVPIVPRPSFTGLSPKFEVALFVWKKRGDEAVEQTEIPSVLIRWVPPKRKRKAGGQP